MYSVQSWKHHYYYLTFAVACWVIQVYHKQILVRY